MSLLLRPSNQLRLFNSRNANLAYRFCLTPNTFPRYQQRRSLFGIGEPITYASIKIAKSLLWSVIGANVAVFGAWNWVRAGRQAPLADPKTQNKVHKALFDNFTLKTEDIARHRWWTSITSAFSHQAGYHIIGNMLGLHAFSSVLIACGVTPMALGVLMFGSAVSGSIGFLWNEQYKPTYVRGFGTTTIALGASGIVMGLGASAAMLAPTASMALYGVLPVPMWLLFAGFTFYDVYYLNNGTTRIGHSAHLGGAAFGAAFYLLALRRLGGIAAF